MTLYYVYFPLNARTLSSTSPERSLLVTPELGPGENWVEDDLRAKSAPSPLWTTSLRVLYGALCYLCVSFASIPVTLVLGSRPDAVWAAGVFGLLSAVTGIFQFVPQILFTATSKV